MDFIVKILRVLLRCHPDESINDAITRHLSRVHRLLYRKPISNEEFLEVLKNCGINKDDNLMVHCSWREFFNYEGTPEMVIKDLMEIIGLNGTLVMPCYGADRYVFNVLEDKSAAGVLSEVFRTSFKSIRSRCSHFSCAAIGKKAQYIVDTHDRSIYGFDEYSPYYRLVGLPNSKIVLLGLGKRSIKLSLYHLPEMILYKTDSFYGSLFKRTYQSTVIIRDNNNNEFKIEHEMLWRESTLPNRHNIYSIYKQRFVTRRRISNIDVVVLDAQQALDYLIKEANKGNYMVKKHW